jgi:hypothetical protein
LQEHLAELFHILDDVLALNGNRRVQSLRFPQHYRRQARHCTPKAGRVARTKRLMGCDAA